MKADTVDVVAFGDIHGDECSPDYTEILEDGLPYHLVSAAQSMKFVGDYARNLGPDTLLLMTGDVFHHKHHASTLAQDILGGAWRSLEDIKHRVGITGNHDMYGSQSLMRGWSGIYSTPSLKRFDSLGLAVCLAPYAKGSNWLGSVATGLRRASATGLRPLVLGHQALMGSTAPIGAGKVIKLQGGVDLKIVADKAIFIMGDIHEGQWLPQYGDTYYAGGLLQRSLSDKGRKPVFLHLRIEGGRVSTCWVHNPCSPLFVSAAVSNHGQFQRAVADIGALKNRTSGGVVFITLNHAKEFEEGLHSLMTKVMTWKGARVALRLRPFRKSIALVGGGGVVQDTSDISTVVRDVVRRLGAPRGTTGLVMSLLEASRSQLNMDAREDMPHMGGDDEAD